MPFLVATRASCRNYPIDRKRSFIRVYKAIEAVALKPRCEENRVIMGLSHLPAPQPAWTRREPGGAHENPETLIRPTALDVSTCTPDLSPLRRPAGPVQLSGMAEDGADARPGPRGGQPPGAVSERTVCGGTPAPAVRRSAASCPASLDLWRRCPGAHGLGARSTPRYLPRDAHGTGLPGPHLGVPRALSLSTALSPAPGLPRASAPSPP